MKSNFTKDIDTEAEVSKFIDKYMYPYISKSFERMHSKEKQHKGIDLILNREDDTLIIDDKCAIYYANKNLKTFIFELSYLNSNNEVREGWLLNQNLETTHYNVMWLNTKQTNIKPWDIKCDNILNVESMIISKNILLDYLNNLGYNNDKLRLIANKFRKSNQTRHKLTPYIELITSTHLKEQPINLKIEKTELKKLAEQHLKITEFGIENLHTDRVVDKPNEPRQFIPYGEKAEDIVYNAMDKYFKGRSDAKVFKHYPVHNIGNQGRYEIDVLTVDKTNGMTVIEVKGIRIDQITSIQGGDWEMKDYFDKISINPYHQAEAQLNALTNHIERESQVKSRFTKRAVIALPYITKGEWVKKGFNKITNLPLILFKDDLEKSAGISKLEDVYLGRKKEAIHNEEWNFLRKYFSIKTDEITLSEVAYSSLYILPSEHALLNVQEEVEEKLYEGIKVILLCYFSVNNHFASKMKDFIQARQLEYFESNQNRSIKEITIINDGKNHKQILTNDLICDFPDFNYKQYEVVHVLPKDNQLVTAGAGTGKTHVMVDRIMYLLANKISLKDVIMITFTNDSTNEMKRRLQNKLTDLSELTGKVHFSEYAEDVKSMQISTIHSYSKTILKTLAHEIGYGTNLKQRSYLHKKKAIIHELIDEYWQTHSNVRKIHTLPHFELIKIINEIWDEMERKGLTEESIKTGLDWGAVSKKDEHVIQELFEYVFTHCEERLNLIKQKENAVSMNDLTRKINELSSDAVKMKQLPKDKYLFMDEFQDSDNTQIELVASLANYLNYKLFIVGDVKQSIYRFRGADYKSFDLIKKEVVNENKEPDFKQFNLNLNYRSAESVLEKLDVVFKAWQKNQWLPADEELVGMYNRPEKVNEFQFIRANKTNAEKAIIQSIYQSMEIISNPEDNQENNNKIALIVRTNNQARMMEKLCNAHNISTLQNLDGTFYTSEAVKDLKNLLDGLLFPNKAIHLVNALQSPYFRYDIPYHLLLQFEGNNEAIIEFINGKINNEFKKYVDVLRTLPILAIIQKIMTDKSFFSHLKMYYSDYIEEVQLDSFLLQYKKNLFHLMNIMEQQFDTMNMTLYNLHKWLTLQMATNRSENEPLIEKEGHSVEITTVHRAKGLQYHTVIIPNTLHSFDAKESIVHIEDFIEGEINTLNKRRIGWKFKYDKNKKQMKNSYYADLDQVNIDEVYKEEARLLYVAMTRVIDRLVVILPNRPNEKTWSELIETSEIEVSNYGS